jgi:hypothetical protein
VISSKLVDIDLMNNVDLGCSGKLNYLVLLWFTVFVECLFQTPNDICLWLQVLLLSMLVPRIVMV